MSSQELAGKVALVTGAARGIGRAIAMELASRGATVVVNYSGSKEKAEEVLSEIQKVGAEGCVYQCNVADYDAVGQMIADVVQKYNKIDILVNNAGINKDGLLMKMTEEDFDAVVNVNLKGTFNGIRHVTRQMLKQRSGRIINMSSIVGLMGNAGQVNYAATKAGVIGITKSAAKELASRGITVNAIAPGYIATDMTDALSDSVKEKILSTIPLGSMGNPEDIARAAAFLASEDARYITGQVISVDGGMSIN
ncbi:MAG: 3-oxoacyl-[acyl-carrier-protein] reductase [Lachnospira sp.]|nr:3-oxoacyl-[acyl-carrier-protein] reductase [Lachnospira sp.]